MKYHKTIWVVFFICFFVIAGCNANEISDDKEAPTEKEQEEVQKEDNELDELTKS